MVSNKTTSCCIHALNHHENVLRIWIVLPKVFIVIPIKMEIQKRLLISTWHEEATPNNLGVVSKPSDLKQLNSDISTCSMQFWRQLQPNMAVMCYETTGTTDALFRTVYWAYFWFASHTQSHILHSPERRNWNQYVASWIQQVWKIWPNVGNSPIFSGPF